MDLRLLEPDEIAEALIVVDLAFDDPKVRLLVDLLRESRRRAVQDRRSRPRRIVSAGGFLPEADRVARGIPKDRNP